MMENNKLDDLYSAEVVGSETIDERECWVLLLEAKVPDAAYHSRKIWVDAERWLPLKEERYAKSGRLLKTTHIEEVFRVAGRWYPKRITFKDKLSRGGGTEYVVEEIDFDEKIPDRMFTKAALRK
jgi:outer membrane lipoprotein-sorting protein